LDFAEGTRATSQTDKASFRYTKDQDGSLLALLSYWVNLQVKP